MYTYVTLDMHVCMSKIHKDSTGNHVYICNTGYARNKDSIGSM